MEITIKKVLVKVPGDYDDFYKWELYVNGGFVNDELSRKKIVKDLNNILKAAED